MRVSKLALCAIGAVCCTPPPVSVTVTAEPLTCRATASEGPFDTIVRTTPATSSEWTWGGGVTVADLDDDGALDVLAPTESGVDVFWGPDAALANVDRDRFADVDLSYASGVSVADYDGDGRLDLYVMRVRGVPTPQPEPSDRGANVLLRNLGDRRFVDVTAEAGLAACFTDVCARTMTASWGDVNGDGWLDLFVGNYGFVDDTPGTQQTDMAPGEPSFLFENRGDGTFASVPLPDEVHDGYTFAGALLDLDNDRDLDLYVVNDFGVLWPNQVLFNEGGELVRDEANRSGLVQSMTGMGLGVGDLNHDGWLDLAIPNWRSQALFESRASRGRWIDTAAAYGLTNARARNQWVGWGTQLGDLDNDGDLDAIVQFGHVDNDNPIWENPLWQGDAVYMWDGERFVDQAPIWDLADPGVGRGAVLADLNRDGALDVIKRDLRGTTTFHLSRCPSSPGLLVRLQQPGPNPFAVGATIDVKTSTGSQRRDVFGGGLGFTSAGPLELHVGADRVRRITVTWPDGATSQIRDVPTNHAVTLTRDR